MNSADVRINCEIIDVEGNNILYSMNDHRRSDPRIVSFRAGYGVSADKSIPFPVCVLSFQQDDEQGFET